MPSLAAEPSVELERGELQAILRSPLFSRSPTLSHLLQYLCEKTFAGESEQIKEYSIALDVLARPDSFDQDTDSIVRVQANRLRKRLDAYYHGEGAGHRLRIVIPTGQYVPVFEEKPAGVPPDKAVLRPSAGSLRRLFASIGLLALVAFVAFRSRRAPPLRPAASPAPQASVGQEMPVGLPVGNEMRILAGATRSYVDRSGKQWNPDAWYRGGTPSQSSSPHMWRTQDPTIYRISRQGDFAYKIPVSPGIYELRLHFAETFYGPEESGGGGEGSRIMSVTLNGRPVLSDFDVVCDAGGSRTADVKVFTDVVPAEDGQLHLSFSSAKGGRGMVSAIEILPGMRGQMRPVRVVARDVPYYSNDSLWWGADAYFKGGQLAATEELASATDDPELYATERWGNFSYAIPATPGKYAVTLYFVERRSVPPTPVRPPASPAPMPLGRPVSSAYFVTAS
jgi:Malectin domain